MFTLTQPEVDVIGHEALEASFAQFVLRAPGRVFGRFESKKFTE
jgi:hypothetical protein